jgi:hypothetical protein
MLQNSLNTFHAIGHSELSGNFIVYFSWIITNSRDLNFFIDLIILLLKLRIITSCDDRLKKAEKY